MREGSPGLSPSGRRAGPCCFQLPEEPHPWLPAPPLRPQPSARRLPPGCARTSRAPSSALPCAVGRSESWTRASCRLRAMGAGGLGPLHGHPQLPEAQSRVLGRGVGGRGARKAPTPSPWRFSCQKQAPALASAGSPACGLPARLSGFKSRLCSVTSVGSPYFSLSFLISEMGVRGCPHRTGRKRQLHTHQARAGRLAQPALSTECPFYVGKQKYLGE